jgi:hypothetical protein
MSATIVQYAIECALPNTNTVATAAASTLSSILTANAEVHTLSELLAIIKIVDLEFLLRHTRHKHHKIPHIMELVTVLEALLVQTRDRDVFAKTRWFASWRVTSPSVLAQDILILHAQLIRRLQVCRDDDDDDMLVVEQLKIK